MKYILKEELDLKPKPEKQTFYYLLDTFSCECFDYFSIRMKYNDYTSDYNMKYNYFFFEFYGKKYGGSGSHDYFRFFTTSVLSSHENQFIIME